MQREWVYRRMTQEGINEDDIDMEGMEQEVLGVEDMHQEDNRRRRPKMRMKKPSERIIEIQLKKVVVVKMGRVEFI